MSVIQAQKVELFRKVLFGMTTGGGLAHCRGIAAEAALQTARLAPVKTARTHDLLRNARY